MTFSALTRAFAALLCSAAFLATPPVDASQTGGPVKVFILAGQSNTEGHGEIGPLGTPGTLETMVDIDPATFGHLANGPGWASRSDVWVWYDRASTTVLSGDLTVGYGASNSTIGPELQFGNVLGDLYGEQVLIIKTAWGGKSLAVDFRPPSSGWSVNPPAAPGDQGFYYQQMLTNVSNVIANIATEFPGYAGQGVEIAGFGWHQGWNDRVNQSYNDEYEANLVNFINDVRADLGVPDLPFVVATTGMAGWPETHPRALSLMAAQLAVEDFVTYPAFQGNVAVVETRDFWRDVPLSPSNQIFHWNRNAETYFRIGEAMAIEMNHLVNPPPAPTGAETIDAVYFAQTHVQKPTDASFGLVSERSTLLKVHVVDPAMPAAPPVTATLTLDGQTLVLPLDGPTALPASIPDGPGVVQHTFADSFRVMLPANWVRPGLEITIDAGAASVTLNNLEIGAPSRLVMTMYDVQYFADTGLDYPEGTFEELELKWPVADLEIRRIPQVVFSELVIPPRANLPAARVSSPAEYLQQTGQPFDGEQAAALAWNGALRRAAGRAARTTLSYINIYGVNAGGQAGGFAGVGNGTSQGVFIHELGHALSLPHWANDPSYPYNGAQFGISPPSGNNWHAGPTWAFDLERRHFIPPTVQPFNVGNHPVGTYKVDPMQGGGNGFQEPNYLMNHFSDYSMNQMREYLEFIMVVWNDSLSSYASWSDATADYTNTVTNDGVLYPIERDVEVISVMASISGSNPSVSMVYPPIGPYTGGLIRRFDPTNAVDRADAQAIFSPPAGSDVCLRITQGGVEKAYMLPASWDVGFDPLSGSSLRTEAINLPASDGAVTRVQLLLTPDAEINGLPADPQILDTWAPLTPDPATFDLEPTAGSATAITMRATDGESIAGDPVEYLFTETSGNQGGTSSGWQTSSTYTDTGLQPSTLYTYQVTMRAGLTTTDPSAEFSASTNAPGTAGTITVESSQQFSLQSGGGLQGVTGLGGFDADGADKLVVTVSTEHAFNNGDGAVIEVRYAGTPLTEVVQEDAGSDRGAVAIFFLDDPGPIGAGTIEVSASNPNGGIGTALALTGTAPGHGATDTNTGSAVNSVTVTTSGDNSLLVAALENSGNPNSAGTSTALAPLTAIGSGTWGSQWGSHASGTLVVPTPSSVTANFSTNTGAGYSINLAAAEFLAAAGPVPITFRRGDCNADGSFDIADVICGLDSLFGGQTTTCLDALDGNDDGTVNIADPIFLLETLFVGGPPPAAPFGACGGDPTVDGIDCGEFAGCP